MMKNTMASVQKLVDQELQMANEQYPLFASDHEGAAVILEEIEEAEDDMENMKYRYSLLWDNIKENLKINDEHTDLPKDLRNAAIHCACECIQVAAMCEKIKLKKE